MILRQLHETRELACDALALSVTEGTAREYALQLLQMSAIGMNQTPVTPAYGLGVASTQALKTRLKQIFDQRQNGRVTAASGMMTLLLALILLPSWSLAEQQHKKDKPTPKSKSSTTVKKETTAPIKPVKDKKTASNQTGSPQVAVEPSVPVPQVEGEEVDCRTQSGTKKPETKSNGTTPGSKQSDDEDRQGESGGAGWGGTQNGQGTGGGSGFGGGTGNGKSVLNGGGGGGKGAQFGWQANCDGPGQWQLNPENFIPKGFGPNDLRQAGQPGNASGQGGAGGYGGGWGNGGGGGGGGSPGADGQPSTNRVRTNKQMNGQNSGWGGGGGNGGFGSGYGNGGGNGGYGGGYGGGNGGGGGGGGGGNQTNPTSRVRSPDGFETGTPSKMPTKKTSGKKS